VALIEEPVTVAVWPAHVEIAVRLEGGELIAD
jgi:hypothetical protein